MEKQIKCDKKCGLGCQLFFRKIFELHSGLQQRERKGSVFLEQNEHAIEDDRRKVPALKVLYHIRKVVAEVLQVFVKNLNVGSSTVKLCTQAVGLVFCRLFAPLYLCGHCCRAGLHHRDRLEESELSTLQIVRSGQQCRFAERVCLHTGMPGSCQVRLEGAGDGRLDILNLEACKG